VRVGEGGNNPRAPNHSKAVGNEASAVLCKNEQRFPFTKTPRPIHLPQANNGEEIMDQKASMIGGGVERSCGGPPRLLLHHRRSSRSPESLQPRPQTQAHRTPVIGGWFQSSPVLVLVQSRPLVQFRQQSPVPSTSPAVHHVPVPSDAVPPRGAESISQIRSETDPVRDRSSPRQFQSVRLAIENGSSRVTPKDV
jgi:hypothetical protein